MWKSTSSKKREMNKKTRDSHNIAATKLEALLQRTKFESNWNADEWELIVNVISVKPVCNFFSENQRVWIANFQMIPLYFNFSQNTILMSSLKIIYMAQKSSNPWNFRKTLYKNKGVQKCSFGENRLNLWACLNLS